MHTSFLLSQKRLFEDKRKYSDLINYYLDKAETVKSRVPYISLKINFPIPVNILIAKDLVEDKIIFIELSPINTKFDIDLTDLRLNWGDFKLVDQTERDNVSVLVFKPSHSKAVKAIELVTRQKVTEDASTLSAEAIKYFF
jgi:hypothetical protein